jgi:hypothetical protein
VSTGDQAAVRSLVEKLLETWAISSERPAAAPAVEAMSSELFEFVFHGSGITELSVTMVNEFSKMFVSALVTARDRGRRAGGSASATDVFNSVLDRRRQLWRD